MARGKLLNDTEIGMIERLKKDGKSNREIARIIGRSPRAVNDYFKRKNSGKKVKRGRPTKVTDHDKRLILRTASNSTLSVRQIQAKSGAGLGKSTVHRIIQGCEYIVSKKMRKRPPLTKQHKLARLQFAREHMTWSDNWKNVVFTDEKKFNLDGPDGNRHYFHDLRKEPIYLSRRQMGGGSLMVWGAVSHRGVVDLKIINGRQNSQKYIDLLNEERVKINEIFADENWIFQQDNAAIHTAACVKTWFQGNNIPILPWPAKSPDLNIIENLWGTLSRRVYINGRQYNSVNELKEAVLQCWREISLEEIRSLYESLPSRIFEVIKNQGGNTNF